MDAFSFISPAAPVIGGGFVPALIDAGLTPLASFAPITAILDAAPPLAAIHAMQAPLASGAAWALLNLMLTIVTVLMMIALAVTYFIPGRDENELGSTKIRKNPGTRLLTVAAAASAIILFLLTENMALPMTIADKWTIWHIVITAAASFLTMISKKTYEDEKAIAETK